jgi:hypothetical protein
MTRREIVSCCFLAMVLCLWGISPGVGHAARPEKVTVILSAFAYQTANGAWHGESGPFLSRLTHALDVSASLPDCDVAYTGTLQPSSYQYSSMKPTPMVTIMWNKW